MKQIRMIVWRIVAFFASADSLRGMLKSNPVTGKYKDREVLGILWASFVEKVNDLRDLMVIIYDEKGKFPLAIRLKAGELALGIIARDDGGDHYLPENNWFDTKEGRSAYFLRIWSSLPELQPVARPVAERYFKPHEKLALQILIGERC